MSLDIREVINEVEKGLPTEGGPRMKAADETLDFYDLKSEPYVRPILEAYPNPFEQAERPYYESGLTHEVVNTLIKDLYSPGPSRTWSKTPGQEFLHRVYSVNHIDAIMYECDRLSTLGGVAAVQVDAADGDFDDQPLKLMVWGPNEFHVWEDPDDRTEAAAVVTVDKYDQQKRYRLWTEDEDGNAELRTFVTSKGDGTSGGRVAKLISTEDSPYGCMPFAFVHYQPPVTCFWRPGLGDFLQRQEENLNVLMSRAGASLLKHIDPIGLIRNGKPGMRLTITTQGFAILPPGGPEMAAGTKGVQPMEAPFLEYIQANPDVAGLWEHIHSYIQQILKALGIPRSAIELEYSGAPSGISLIVDEWPLLDRALARQGAFGVYESDLAKIVLRAGGIYHKQPGLVEEAKGGTLSLAWPSARTPITQDWLDTESQKVTMGISSVIMVTQAAYGCDRDRAIKILEQVREDREELEEIDPIHAPPIDTQGEPDSGSQGSRGNNPAQRQANGQAQAAVANGQRG